MEALVTILKDHAPIVAIVLLAVLYLGNKMDSNQAEIRSDISSLSERVAGLEATVQGIDRRLDGIEGRLLRLENHIFKVEPQN